MKQGNQFYLELQIHDEDLQLLDINAVSKVQFNIKDLTKIYDGLSDEVTYDFENNCFKIWLTEEETFDFKERTKIDARILFKNDIIMGTYIIDEYFYQSLKKEKLTDV